MYISPKYSLILLKYKIIIHTPTLVHCQKCLSHCFSLCIEAVAGWGLVRYLVLNELILYWHFTKLFHIYFNSPLKYPHKYAWLTTKCKTKSKEYGDLTKDIICKWQEDGSSQLWFKTYSFPYPNCYGVFRNLLSFLDSEIHFCSLYTFFFYMLEIIIYLTTNFII